MPLAPSDPRRSLGAQRPGDQRTPRFQAPWTPLGTLPAGIHPQTHIRPSVGPAMVRDPAVAGIPLELLSAIVTQAVAAQLGHLQGGGS